MVIEQTALLKYMTSVIIEICAVRAYNPHFKEYDICAWKDIIDVFAMKISCLYGMSDMMEYEQYSSEVTPSEIYAMEAKEAENKDM